LNTPLFISDDNAFMEPHNDIISTSLVIIGFVVFAAILSSTYFAFDDNSYALDNYKHASMIANDIANYQSIQGSRVDLISAEKLDLLSTPAKDKEKHRTFFQRFSGNMDLSVDISTNDGKYHWTIDRDENQTSKNEIIAASVPVVIELGSNVNCAPGTLTVSVRKNKWI